MTEATHKAAIVTDMKSIAQIKAQFPDFIPDTADIVAVVRGPIGSGSNMPFIRVANTDNGGAQAFTVMNSTAIALAVHGRNHVQSWPAARIAAMSEQYQLTTLVPEVSGAWRIEQTTPADAAANQRFHQAVTAIEQAAAVSNGSAESI
jgi:hypothetical protein